ncbi:MAG: hypothetical protein BGO78_15985 [Chloroflexi bacterium 44-23]|nr:MAG: hypothetical protein BGO78_15985 [Chloroflexi bacterium 44-23]
MNEDLELSEREIDIIRLVATGASNKEIAQILVISPNTVKVHLRNIFTKLNVVSRTEATMAAISRGWVESPKNLNASAFIEEEPDNFSGLIAESDLKNKRSPWLYVLISAAALLILATAFLLWNNAQINQRAAQVNTIAATTSAARRWEMLTPLATGLKNMAALRYERSFYLFGGINSSGTNPDVLIFNIDENSWSLGAKKPKPVSHIQAAALGEKIYIPGGINSENQVIADLEIYDPRESSWETRAIFPHPISRYGLVAFEGKIFLFGGWDGIGFQSDVWVYNPVGDTWEKFGSMPKKCADLSVAVVNGVIHLFGGINENGVLDWHYQFFPQRKLNGDDPWEEAKAMPFARYGMGISVLADMVYIAGGTNETGEPLPIVQYLPVSDEWVEIDQPPQPIGAFPAVLPSETRLYIIGGELDDTIQTDNQVYQAVYTILVPVIR